MDISLLEMICAVQVEETFQVVEDDSGSAKSCELTCTSFVSYSISTATTYVYRYHWLPLEDYYMPWTTFGFNGPVSFSFEI